MRKVLAIMVVLGTALALIPNAKAQIPVIDAANLGQAIQELAQDEQTVTQLKSQLIQLQETYQMFTSPTNVMGMATNLENSNIENPMPAANALAGLTGGQTAPSGAGVTFYDQNHIYTPTDGSTDSTQLISNAQGIANIEGIASINLSSIQTRLQDLPNLEDDLSTASSITQVNAINGRIAAESQFVQAQQAQAANLQVLASEQQASQLQQQQELKQEDYSNVQSMLQTAATSTN